MPADSSPFDVEATLHGLWGHANLDRDAGVLHVVSTWSGAAGRHVIRITPQSPKSDTDVFLLNLARARADVVLTTGRILREEPHLEYSLPPAWAPGMIAWRERAMGRSTAPKVAVLTSGRDLNVDHPALHGWAPPVIVTSHDAARALRPRLPGHVDVIGLKLPSAREAIACFAASGAKTISIEAGPSTARALYAEPSVVDELWMSEFLGSDLAHAFQGPIVFPGKPGGTSLNPIGPQPVRPEASGRWRFSRFRRGPMRSIAPQDAIGAG